jgi:UDP-glucose 4-epimerase
MKQRVLVTGGAGFIGSHTVDLLLEHDKTVTVYDNFSGGKLTNLNVFHPELTVVQGDILDYQALAKEINKCDAVLHLAALPSVPKSIEAPLESLKVNTLGFVHVLQAIRDAKRDIRLVYASSAAVYGDATILPCNDELSLTENFLSPYALEKAGNEQYARLFSHLSEIKSLGLRYFNVYGARQDPGSSYSGVISKFIANYAEQQPVVIFGDGKQIRDFIHVSDIARANLLALESEYCGVLNIATGVPETLLDLVRYIEMAGKHPVEIQFAEERSGDIRESYACVNKAREHLKFESLTSLQQGIERLCSV